MIKAWRIVKAKHKKTAFTGVGSRFASGRWHELMIPIVYTSDSLASVAYETFIHLQEDGKHIKFVSFEVHLPSNLIVQIEDMTKLPKHWRTEPPSAGTKKIGSEWCKSSVSAVLSVPSVHFPKSRNYLLNPHHGDFTKIVINKDTPFSFDPRMWK